MSQVHWIGPRDEEGRPHGRGQQNYGNGDIYQGPMVHGVKHGDNAIYRERLTPAGSGGTKQYQGSFKDDKKHGEAQVAYSNGDFFQGKFENGAEHGEGTFRTTLWDARGTYQANWVNGKIQAGSFRTRAGRRYGTFRFSDFENGAPTRFSSVSYCTGDEYVGEIENWLRHGAGKLTTVCSRTGFTSVYEGNWANNNLHGKGTKTRTHPNGTDVVESFEGDWVNGQRHGAGKSTSVNNLGMTIVQEGNWANGNLHGHAKITTTRQNGNVDTFEGEHVNGEKHGKGTGTFHNGDRFVGEYRNNRRDGQGTYTMADGTSITGLWVNGRRVGQHQVTRGGRTYTTSYGEPQQSRL